MGSLFKELKGIAKGSKKDRANLLFIFSDL